MGSSSHLRKRLLIGGTVILIVLIAAGVTFAMSTWSEVNRVTIDRSDMSSDAPEAAAPDEDATAEPSGESDEGEPGFVEPSDGVDVFLLVGSDSRSDLDSLEGFGDFEGTRADVVMLLLRTEREAAVLSLPRDLLVENICTGNDSRLNGMLEGCGDELNGATLLTLTVENLIGQRVDHFAMVDLAGFQDAVDAVGGYEICVENPVRDGRANLELPAGCTMATGDQALSWLRSRQTQELTEDGWRIMVGVSDLARNERQRDFLIEMMSRLADFSSPQDIAATAQAVAPYLTVDSELSLVSAVDLAWTMRGLASGALSQLEVPVYDYLTDAGASVLLPVTPVDQIVAGFVTPETAGGSSPQAAS
ncbi:MAG: LCP family protein [Actinomycetota bacterium]|nr:LCP family protein [Actinomycetota bacterium]